MAALVLPLLKFPTIIRLKYLILMSTNTITLFKGNTVKLVCNSVELEAQTFFIH